MDLWFRYYTGTVNNIKVQSLPAALFKAWVNLICLAKENHGVLPALPDIAFQLRSSESQISKWVDELISRRLLDETESGIVPHDWDEHQYTSDCSTNRVKKFREARKKRPPGTEGNVSSTVSGTTPEQSRAETEQSRAETENKTAAANVRIPVQICDFRFPETLAAVRQSFPLADAKIATDIALSARARLPDAGDSEIAEAVRVASLAMKLKNGTSKQYSAGLFIGTVPTALESVRRASREFPHVPKIEADQQIARIRELWGQADSPEGRAEIEKLWPEIFPSAPAASSPPLHGKKTGSEQ